MTSIVIVSWNSHEDIKKLIRTLDRPEAQSLIEIIIVDNNSSQNSQEALRCISTDFIKSKKIFNSGNFGFGRACNIGFTAAEGDVLLFLNPDTVVDVKLVLEASARLRGVNDYQILGVQQVSDHGVARTCCRSLTRMNTFISCSGLNKVSQRLFKGFEMTEWDHLQSRFVGHVIGAFYCMKRSSFELLKGFDESFFLYYEDLDFSMRAAKAGLKIFFDASLLIYHKGGGSSEKIGTLRLEYSIFSRDKMIEKHFGRIQQVLCRMSAVGIELPLRICEASVRGRYHVLAPILKVYWKLLCSPFPGGLA